MAGSHALTPRVTAWTIATLTRLGRLDEARAALAAVTGEMAKTVEIRNASATLRLAEDDPGAARRELATVLDGRARGTNLAGVEAYLLDAMARRDLGDERGAQDAVERALDLAEPDRLILPFAMVDSASLLAAQPRRTAHAAFVQDIHDVVGTGGTAANPAAALVEQLSPTELRVLRFLPTNLTRPEIAEQLAVSVNTVNTHIRRIYTKLGTTDRSAAVQRGRELRLLAGGRVAGNSGTDG
jgi:LuxR family maltose regulon positive regulatory protein